jgi:spore coat protein A
VALASRHRSAITLAPAERADIIINFGSLALGTTVELRNTLVSSTSSVYKIMQFKVNSTATDTSVVPSTLRPVTRIARSQAERTRNFTLSMTGGMMTGNMMWTINGLVWDENRVDATPRVDGPNMEVHQHVGMDHPCTCTAMFRYDNQRRALPPMRAEHGDRAAHEGTAEIIMKFTSTLANSAHCHVLEHEEMMMMSQFEVCKHLSLSSRSRPYPRHSCGLPGIF